jgi:hypothetical protein
MFICAEEILGAAVDVCEIAAAAAGDEDFLSDAIGAFDDGDAPTALASFGSAEKPCGTGAEDESVKFVR